MIAPDITILYVDQPESSAQFYSRLLGIPPVELSATFALWVGHNGFRLALWSKHSVQPAPAASGGGGELGFLCEQPEQVDALYRQWRDWQFEICQRPLQLAFGYSFVACDPDGHRLRVYTLNR
ncbi:VOC family protein [Serratia sp. AKBS12]|uniref:VOC family protein n=1 Tax=Serratia sp. AKBS12 TaxID=2974597 RepID=UPI002165FB4A|nr:VOC family protein [Serratia sp. AKBS12]MCS3408785.1 VOC family protein [Serratia sp. AKBS12]